MVLHGLCFLKVDKAYSGKELYFSALSFPKLRRLDIWGAPQLNHVKIEDGALGSLVELEFSYCPELKNLPYGIEFLLFLEELSLKDTAEQLIEKLRQESEANECGEELMKINHIRKVVIKLTAKNIWQRIH
jgi:disease resistance protein RPM1